MLNEGSEGKFEVEMVIISVSPRSWVGYDSSLSAPI